MSDIYDNNSKDQRERQMSFSREIDRMVEDSKEKLSETDLDSRLEELLDEKTEALREQRRRHYENSLTRRQRRSENEDDVRIVGGADAAAAAYRAHLAKLRYGGGRRVSESLIHRLIRFFRTITSVNRGMSGKDWYTDDRRRLERMGVFRDCFGPYCEKAEDAADTAWNFLANAGRGLWEIVLFLTGLVIKAGYYLWSFILFIGDVLAVLRFKIELHKRFLFQQFAILLILFAAGAWLVSSATSYEYSYYGNVLGYAKSEDDVYKTIAVIGDKLSETTGATVSLDVENDIQFRKVYGFNQKIDSADDILNNLTYMRDLQVEACVVSINGKKRVVVDTETTAARLLQSILDQYQTNKNGVEYTDAYFAETIEYSKEMVSLSEISNYSKAKAYLMTGSTTGVAHEGGKPLLNVCTVETEIYNEEIEYGVKYIDNASIYAGETEVKSDGVNGVRKITATVTRVNGVESSRTVIATTTVKEPVDQVIYRGTKPIPESIGTGTFAYPIKTYTISSRFGMRWGRMHTGVDFASSTGTKIYAADGGTVIYADYKGSYGQLVIIDHGGLFQTYYAHCSQILVHEGEKVYQGQNIALVRSTGNSTVPHLHFEVRYNGEPMNPLDYL